MIFTETDNPVRVLLVEDDPDDYVLTRDLLEQSEGMRVDLHWTATCSEGLDALRMAPFDAILLDYRLGAQTGLDFLGRMPLEVRTPVILLTGQADRQTDVEAMKAGAADYLVKSEITAMLLERSIRYAIERYRAQEAQHHSEQFRAGQTRVLEMVARGQPLETVLTQLVLNVEAGRDLRCAILLVESDGACLRVGAAPSLPEELRTAGEGMPIGPASGSCGTSAYRRETVLVTDVASNPLWEQYLEVAERAEVGACWSRPIFSTEGAVLGTVCTYYRAARGPTADEEALVENLTHTAAIAIERAGAEAALRQSERRFRSLAENSPDIVARFDRESRHLYVSPAVERITGIPAEEFIGKTKEEVGMPEPHASVWRERMRHAFETGEPVEMEFDLHAPHGRVWLETRLAPERGLDGQVDTLLEVTRDVTERRRADLALRESEAKFRQVAGHIQQVIWMFDPDFSQAIYVSSAYEGIWGTPVESVYRDPRSFLATVHPEDLEGLRAAMDQIQYGFTDACEYRILRTDGEERWLRSRGFAVRDEDGVTQRVVGTTEDITDLVHARLELERSESRYRRLVRTAPQAIYALDVEGRFTEANAAAEELLGRRAAELVGQHFSAVIAAEDLPRVAALRRERMEDGQAIAEVEFEIVRPSGERRLICVAAAVIREGTEIRGTHGVARDITEERAREQTMRLLSTALDRLEQGVSVVDARDLRGLYSNAAYAQLLGTDPEHAHNPVDHLPDEAARTQLVEIRKVLRERGQWSGRVRRRRRDNGRVVPLDVVVGEVQIEDGQEVIVAIMSDASEAIERERRMRRVERLASVGTLLSGVAHELNNPLHAVRNFTELLLMQPRPQEEREDLRTVQRECDRMAKIVGDLRTIARQTQGECVEREPVDLNDIVRHVLKLRRYALETRNMELREDLDDALPPVLAERSEIEQVVLNLVVNAEQAMAGFAGERRLILRTRRTPGGASLHVIDSGPGISPEHLERVFDPFFTTKDPQEGTGLGLSLVHSIVTEHGGEIRIDSTPGKGAAFRIDLPLAAEPAVKSPSGVAEQGSPEPLRVLVVDDEPSIRRATIIYLSRRGHTVDQAGEGGEALRLLDDNDYDVVLSDLRMPGLGGEEFLERLGERGLTERVIFMTGDAAGGIADRVLREARVPILIKPVKLEEVARAVEARARRLN